MRVLAVALTLLLQACGLFNFPAPKTPEPTEPKVDILQRAIDNVVEIGGAQPNDTYCSGVAVEAVILTAYHCVEDEKEFGIKFRGKWYEGKVYATWPEKDLAVIVAIGARLKDTVPLSEHAPVLGQTVVWMGYPVGLHLQLGKGIVSHPDDDLYFDVYGQFLPGNSGGPVFDEHGELLGIVSSTLTMPAFPIPQFLPVGHAVHWRHLRAILDQT